MMRLPEENKIEYKDLESLVHREQFEKFSRNVSCIIALFLLGCIVGLFLWLFI
jgi:hypothetical protein